ncbi:BofC N-terminal domain-containing protein [Halobacillus sp. Marseille-P3879]|uniref:BofC N-terminal domain-containing protein n=1 Tax=Halobacillus TaxID=45667 RepID=UPI000C7DB2AC|nr:BofC N-terminal domain-containing protein [Halobacillus sp. Marseille-P3879]
MQTIWISIVLIISLVLQPAPEVTEKRAVDHSYASTSTFNKDVPAFVYQEPLELKVILKTYDDDELVDTEVTNEKIWAMEDFWSNYDGWTVEDQKIGQIVFQRQVDHA